MATLIDIYTLVVLVAVVMSWLPAGAQSNPLAMIAYRLTEPVLNLIRSVIPPMGGLDLSPMVLLLALQMLKRLV